MAKQKEQEDSLLYMREYIEEFSEKIPKKLWAVLPLGQGRQDLVKITFHRTRSCLVWILVTFETKRVQDFKKEKATNQKNRIYRLLINFFPHFQLMREEFFLHLALCPVPRRLLRHPRWMSEAVEGRDWAFLISVSLESCAGPGTKWILVNAYWMNEWWKADWSDPWMGEEMNQLLISMM